MPGFARCPYDGYDLYHLGAGSGTSDGTSIMDELTAYCPFCGRAFET